MHGSYLKLFFLLVFRNYHPRVSSLRDRLTSEGDIGIISQAAIMINCTTSSAMGSLTFWS